MFALPYVFNEAGFLAGFLYLTVFTAVFSAIHLMYSDIIAGTPGKHRFVGYAEIYLGKVGRRISIVTVLAGLLLTLTIYLILSASFIKLIFPALSPVAGTIIFWLISSAVIVMSLKRLANFEFAVTVAMIAIVFIIFFFGLKQINFGNPKFLPQGDYSLIQFLLPYGAVLFALSGRGAISSMRDYFERNSLDISMLKPAIILGTVVPAVVYTIFILAITWLSPTGVTADSVSGIQLTHPLILSLIGLLGIFVIWTSYFFLGLEVKDILRYDFKMPPMTDLVLVVFLPLILYFYNSDNFIWFVSIVGGIFLAAESIFVVLMRHKLRPIGAWGYFIVLVFFGGLVYEVLKNFL